MHGSVCHGLWLSCDLPLLHLLSQKSVVLYHLVKLNIDKRLVSPPRLLARATFCLSLPMDLTSMMWMGIDPDVVGTASWKGGGGESGDAPILRPPINPPRLIRQ